MNDRPITCTIPTASNALPRKRQLFRPIIDTKFDAAIVIDGVDLTVSVMSTGIVSEDEFNGATFPQLGVTPVRVRI